MLQTQQAVIEILKADDVITALFPGKVWNRELRKDGEGNTAQAWAPIDPDDQHSPDALRPALVVRDAGEFGSGFKLGGNARVMVFAYAYASDQGRAVLAQADARIHYLFSRVGVAIPAGDGQARFGEFRVGAKSPILDEPAYGGTMFCSWQLTFMTAVLDTAAL